MHQLCKNTVLIFALGAETRPFGCQSTIFLSWAPVPTLVRLARSSRSLQKTANVSLKGLRCANRRASRPRSWNLTSGPSRQLRACQGVCSPRQPGQGNPIPTASSPGHRVISRKHRKKHPPTPPHQSFTPFVQDQPSDPGSHNSFLFSGSFPGESLRLLLAAKSPACRAFNLRGHLRLHQVGEPCQGLYKPR